jgi:hypothetical protein
MAVMSALSMPPANFNFDHNVLVYCLHTWPQQPLGQDVLVEQTDIDLHS